ncbi:hypothetical protein [Spirosoma gilvum]
MKNLIVFTVLFLIASLSFGQCDKEVTLVSAKTEYLDGSGVVQRTVDEQSTVVISQSQVMITPGNADHKMVGTIQSTTCTWGTPYQEGTTVLKATFDDPSGTQRHATLTIAGKAGLVTLLMEVAEMPDRKIRVAATSFKETKKQ